MAFRDAETDVLENDVIVECKRHVVEYDDGRGEYHRGLNRVILCEEVHESGTIASLW